MRARMSLEDVLGGERRQFASDGRAVGGGWPRGKASWRREKAERHLDPRPMRATGRLQHALESGTGMTFRAFNGTLTWGIPLGRSDVYYAAPLARRRRRAVVIDPVATDRIAGRISGWIADGVIVG